MHDIPSLGDLDSDGALQEAAAKAGVTRSQLIRRSAFVGGGLIVGGLPVAFSYAQGASKGDVDILNYALTLEYLEAAFYAEAVEKNELSGKAQRFAQVVGQHEQAHVDALKQVLGSKAVKEPKFDFADATGKAKFLRTAQVLEDTGVAAYQGQAHRIKTPDVLAAAGAILAVEARHAAWVRDIIGGGKGVNPAPDAFEVPKSMDAVLAAVKGTGFLKG